jgi:hypothetical protein
MTTAVQQQFIKVAKVDYLDGFRLHIVFDDGTERTVDFEPFLAKSHHPEIRKYLDKRRFKKFTVDRGHLHWNDYDLIFPTADLYAGDIS